MNNIIKLISNKQDKEEVILSILNTYFKIIETEDFNELISVLKEEDIKNIEKFYIYLSLESAKNMLHEDAKEVAYEEMQNYVGTLIYSKEIKKAFLETYMNLLEHYRDKLLRTDMKKCSLLEYYKHLEKSKFVQEDTSLKLA